MLKITLDSFVTVFAPDAESSVSDVPIYEGSLRESFKSLKPGLYSTVLEDGAVEVILEFHIDEWAPCVEIRTVQVGPLVKPDAETDEDILLESYREALVLANSGSVTATRELGTICNDLIMRFGWSMAGIHDLAERTLNTTGGR